jgi:hypothetical protein
VALIVNRHEDIVKDGEAALVGCNSRATVVPSNTLKVLRKYFLSWPRATTAFEETLETALRGSKEEKGDLDLGNGGKRRARSTRHTLVSQGTLH